MSPATYYVLAALSDERLHGYAIIEKVERLSGGDVSLAVGTLYGALERLARQKLVEPDGEETVSGRLRRYYRITAAGEKAARAEAARLGRAARALPRRQVRTA